MYTKKVLKHFKNPKNLGKIKNPDGIGVVGNLVCLPPEEKIHINNKSEEIQLVSLKNKVLSHIGTYNRISRTTTRNYVGKILTIRNRLGRTSITPDHLVLAIKIPKKLKFLRTKNKKLLIPGWYHAEQLEKGDIALYPIPKKEKDLKYIKIDIPKSKWDFRSKELPSRIPLSAGLLRLFGYFLSEGNIQDKPCRTFIVFTLNIRENKIVQDIRQISQNLFGLSITVRRLPKRKAIVVYIYSARLARFFKKIFGNGAAKKKIPDFIMTLPAEKQRSLIFGLWKGDGYVNLNRNGPRAGYATISYQLVQQIKTLLLRQKIIPSIYIDRAKRIKGVNHKRAYRVHVGQRDSLARLCSILDIKYHPSSHARKNGWYDNNFLYTPITGIKRQEYKGKVCNLEVQNAHSFTSEAFCLHNCGDVMHLYIKIGKNKRGEDILEDIKFETLGCVAAIATSSIITEIAKGKTIEAALNLGKKEIMEKLGGLPPVKLHCSVLAIDALNKAIYNYLLKNKKEVPEKLKKRHKRLEKERVIIEEKFGEWRK